MLLAEMLCCAMLLFRWRRSDTGADGQGRCKWGPCSAAAVKIPPTGLNPNGCALVSPPPHHHHQGLTDARCQPPVGQIKIAPSQETSVAISLRMDLLGSGVCGHGCHRLGSWENQQTALAKEMEGEWDARIWPRRTEFGIDAMGWTDFEETDGKHDGSRGKMRERWKE